MDDEGVFEVMECVASLNEVGIVGIPEDVVGDDVDIDLVRI